MPRNPLNNLTVITSCLQSAGAELPLISFVSHLLSFLFPSVYCFSPLFSFLIYSFICWATITTFTREVRGLSLAQYIRKTVSIINNHHVVLNLYFFDGLWNQLPSACGSIITPAKQSKISVRGSDRQTKECTWLSIPSQPSPQNEVITFHFTYFDVPCKHGHVILLARDDTQIQKFCGADPPQVSSLPATSQIMVKLKLTKGAAVWGFDLKYRTEYLGKIVL